MHGVQKNVNDKTRNKPPTKRKKKENQDSPEQRRLDKCAKLKTAKSLLGREERHQAICWIRPGGSLAIRITKFLNVALSRKQETKEKEQSKKRIGNREKGGEKTDT